MKSFQPAPSNGDRDDSPPPSMNDLLSRCKKLERENEELRSKLLEERIMRTVAEDQLKSLNDVAYKMQEYAERLVSMSAWGKSTGANSSSSSSSSNSSNMNMIMNMMMMNTPHSSSTGSEWESAAPWRPSPADSWNPVLAPNSGDEKSSSPPKDDVSLLSTSAPAGFSKIPRTFVASPAIPIIPSLRSSAPEFKSLLSSTLSAASMVPSGVDASSSSYAPATVSSLSVDSKLLSSSSDTSGSSPPQSSSPPEWHGQADFDMDKGACFLLCDVSRDVSLEGMEKCVQEKFDLSANEMRLEFGEGGPGAGRVAFVFVNNGESANKLATVKRFRAVVDGIKMRMKVTHISPNVIDQYR